MKIWYITDGRLYPDADSVPNLNGNVPCYPVHSNVRRTVKNLFVNILTGTDGGIMNVSGYADIMAENFKMTGRMTNVDWGNIDSAVTAMNSFSADQWETLKSLFPAYAGVIAENQTKITEMNTFLTINVSQNPTFGLSIAVLIPILSGLSQYISVKGVTGKYPDGSGRSDSGINEDDDTVYADYVSIYRIFCTGRSWCILDCDSRFPDNFTGACKPSL